jgi:hypothetical protein
MSGLDIIIEGVCVADKYSVVGTRSTIAATCSFDDSVRLWGVDEAVWATKNV